MTGLEGAPPVVGEVSRVDPTGRRIEMTIGSDDGLVQTALGPFGLACGWEYGRVRTVNRLAGRVRLLGGGMFFAGYPTWRATAPWFRDREQELMLQYARETPPRMARMLGVAVAHASHVGDYEMETMLVPGLAWKSEMAGETQICERDGTTLGRLSSADGEGYIAAEMVGQTGQSRIFCLELTESALMEDVERATGDHLVEVVFGARVVRSGCIRVRR